MNALRWDADELALHRREAAKTGRMEITSPDISTGQPVCNESPKVVKRTSEE